MKRFLWLLMSCGLVAAVIAIGMADIDTGPRPEIRVVQIVSHDAEQNYLLEVVNPGSRDLEYWGYGAENPMYQMESYEAASGEWKDAMMGWCGMGAAPQRLAAHSSQRFEVSVRDAPSRVGLLLLPPSYQRGRVFQFDWLPFSIRESVVAWQNGRLDERTKKRMVWSEKLEPLPPVTTMLTTQVTEKSGMGGMP
ncbi:hypothetical protein DES53_109241 [Roseimicrobium gellanilyticum]|uniref:Uncharacterized protein n=1 Tax=Roseimicrobium gellanilyticum TaxID=748857 RepID=A0A366HBU0_9BACT|nr:hypothetical protein [Roseimicrobium gellanilyticum]RBP39813.1 hypothetical protein DES53_109241 [Roseimicrobium gellanilyticum]